MDGKAYRKENIMYIHFIYYICDSFTFFCLKLFSSFFFIFVKRYFIKMWHPSIHHKYDNTLQKRNKLKNKLNQIYFVLLVPIFVFAGIHGHYSARWCVTLYFAACILIFIYFWYIWLLLHLSINKYCIFFSTTRCVCVFSRTNNNTTLCRYLLF